MMTGDHMKIIKKLILWCFLLLIMAGGVVTFFGSRQYKDAVGEISIADKVAEIQTSSTYVPYEKISPSLLQATVAIEDHRFYTHHGIDYIATARALLTNIFQQEIVGGGSTITQQLAKNMYFGYHTSLIRKISELFVAHDLESQYTKEEILTLYVNIINYGDNHMGIKEASEGYFHTTADNLTLEQASLLAGLPQSPANYQLSNHYEQALLRQQQVLKAMVREDMITQTQMDAIIQK